MSILKTTLNDASVTDYLAAVPDETKRNDSFTLLELFTKVTGEQPCMWGTSIIGFGSYHYTSDRSKQEGDWMLTGFSPRKQNLTLYLGQGTANYKDLLEKLGKHKTSVGCLYIKKLADIDLVVLEKLIAISFADMKKKYS